MNRARVLNALVGGAAVIAIGERFNWWFGALTLFGVAALIATLEYVGAYRKSGGGGQ